MNPRSKCFPAWLLACTALMLAACGNKGPLTLPGEPVATKPKTLSTPSAAAPLTEQPADHIRPPAAQPR